MGQISLLGAMTAIPWCLLVLAAFAGWGDALLRGARQERSWRNCFVVGLGFVVALGGLLNLVREIRAGVCIALMVAGVVLAVVKFAQEGVRLSEAWMYLRVRRWAWVVGSICAALLLVRVMGSVHRVGYQYLDDLSEYLTFPKKMLEMHFYARDPFSERRIINSVGPAYFVQALVVSAVPLMHVQMADTALGLCLLAIFLMAVMKEWRVGLLVSGVVVALAIGTMQSTFNLSFTTLPSALFVGMVMVAASETQRSNAVMLGVLEGMLVAVMIGLKAVYLPHAAIFCAVLLVVLVWQEGVAFAGRAVVGAVGAFVVVLGPWMVAMRRTSGTYLYPLLGKGYHYDAYRRMESVRGGPWPDGTVLLLFAVPTVLVLLTMVVCRGPQRRLGVVAALAIAASVGSLALVWATGGDSPIRYNAPSLVPAMLLVLAAIACGSDGARRWVGCGVCVVALWIVIEKVDHSLTYGPTHAMTEVGAFAHNFAAGFHRVELPYAADRASYEAVEAAIPAGAITLTTMRTPFFFDFSKREILLAGFPGAASLPPGWPVDGDGDALAAYLLANHVGYLAYSYGDSANYSDAALKATIALPNGTAVIRNEARLILAAHGQYAELAATRKHVFDDGRMYLLDLAQRK